MAAPLVGGATSWWVRKRPPLRGNELADARTGELEEVIELARD